LGQVFNGIPRKSIIKWGVIAVAVVMLLTLPLWWNDLYVINIVILIFSYLALGEMWNFLGGYAGLPSLGQQVFVGIGGYAMAVMLQTYKQPIFLCLAASFVFCVIFALAISAPIFNLSKMYFTIGTCILSLAVSAWFSNWDFVHYNAGINISRAFNFPPMTLYLLSVGIGLFSVAAVYIILRTKWGLGLMAMRDNAKAAEVRGVKLYQNKLWVFLISAGITGVTGGIIYLNLGYIKTDSAFSMNWTITCVFMVIIGGIGTIEGPIIGAFIYILLRQLLYNFPGLSMIILGCIAVVAILVMPKGIMGILQKWNFDIFSVRRAVKKRPQTGL